MHAAERRARRHENIVVAEMSDQLGDQVGAVFRHRLRTTYEADARGIDSGEIVRRVLDAVPAP